MAKNKLPISDVKDANDACCLITKLTESYADDSGSPEDHFIYNLRQVALKGLQAENDRLAISSAYRTSKLTTKNGLIYRDGGQLGCSEAEAEARKHGFAFAEQLVAALSIKQAAAELLAAFQGGK